MTKIVTLRLEKSLYERLKRLAEAENRPLSNYIATAAKKCADESIFASDEEMTEILSDEVLMDRIKRGTRQARAKRGRLVG